MARTDHLNHKPDADGIEKIEHIRRACIELERLIDQFVPRGREEALARTKLEECRMWAIKGIAMKYPAEELSC